jgi:hypothetical protein
LYICKKKEEKKKIKNKKIKIKIKIKIATVFFKNMGINFKLLRKISK